MRRNPANQLRRDIRGQGSGWRREWGDASPRPVLAPVRAPPGCLRERRPRISQPDAGCGAQHRHARGLLQPRPEQRENTKLAGEEQAVLDQQLRAAAWDNDVARARRLIGQGADVNAKDDTKQSAYLVATSEGYLDLLRLMLRSGARVNDKDSWNGTGLIRAAERGHGYVVGALLQAGIDRDHINRIGYQAIHEAVWLGEDTREYETTVRALAAGGVQLDRVSPSAGLTPLQMARERGHDRLERILAHVTAAKPPTDPEAALLRAAREGDADQVAVALRAGADIEVRDARREDAPAVGQHLRPCRCCAAPGRDGRRSRRLG